MAGQESADIAKGHPMYQSILVPLDGSPTAERGLREAIALAGRLGSELTLLHVLDDYPLYTEFASAVSYQQSLELMRSYGQEQLDKARTAATQAGLQARGLLLPAEGRRVADIIVEQARQQGCSLIVMGSHGRRGLNRLLMGSDAELVLRHSPVPVLMLRDSPTDAAP